MMDEAVAKASIADDGCGHVGQGTGPDAITPPLCFGFAVLAQA
jgi:hypothetical protein